MQFKTQLFNSLEYAYSEVFLPGWVDGSYMRSSKNIDETPLKPRELLGLTIMGHIANFLSNEKWLPGWVLNQDSIAHDGVLICQSGERKYDGMVLEQTMATLKAKDATPTNLSLAVIRAIEKKCSKGGEQYTADSSLVVYVDYTGKIDDLRKLSKDVQKYSYEAIYVIALISPGPYEFVCITLKNPRDPLDPKRVLFDKDGNATIEIMHEQ